MTAFALFTWVVVFLYTTTAQVRGFNLTILHTNDIHSRIEEMNKHNGRCTTSDSGKGKCYGGVERLKSKIDELRAAYPNSILLDAGDQYQGTLFYFLFGGQVMSHFMNLLGYDAMALGNHEFDAGVKGLAPFVNNATFNVLSSNIDPSQTPAIKTIKKSVILKVKGESVGIIGYTTTDTPLISQPGKVKFKDEIESIQAEVDQLTSRGVNKLVALGHAGFEKDKEIARKVRGLDIVVGGHTNTFLYTGAAPANDDPVGAYPTIEKNADGQNVLVVQDFAYGKYLGFLQVNFDDKGVVTAWNGNPILMDKTVPKDRGITAALKSYLPAIEIMKNDVIGKSFVHLNGSRASCRVHECNMGNLVADSMVRQNLRYSDSVEWNDVSIALLNGGSIRSSIAKGDITASDIMELAPFRNTVDIVELSGQHIWESFEHSASKYVTEGDLYGEFLQMSGMRVVYDMEKPVGSRVVEAHALCADCSIPEFKPLNMTKWYKVVLSSFMIGGGGGFTMIRDNHRNAHMIGDLDTDVILSYIKENSPMTHGLDGRIQFKQDIERSHSRYCAAGVATMAPLSFLLFICLFVSQSPEYTV